MPQTSPAMNQWQQRFNAAQARVRAAEQSRDAAQVRAAYEQLRQIQSVRPANQPAPQGQMQQQPRQQRRGVLSTVNNAMRGRRPQ